MTSEIEIGSFDVGEHERLSDYTELQTWTSVLVSEALNVVWADEAAVSDHKVEFNQISSSAIVREHTVLVFNSAGLRMQHYFKAESLVECQTLNK